ncbi:hypothetical protein CIK69_14670 [Brachybacterium alimentarium]|nr:hypothetical protein CIK69_14670 [Brachybacterium alimentarium]
MTPSGRYATSPHQRPVGNRPGGWRELTSGRRGPTGGTGPGPTGGTGPGPTGGTGPGPTGGTGPGPAGGAGQWPTGGAERGPTGGAGRGPACLFGCHALLRIPR